MTKVYIQPYGVSDSAKHFAAALRNADVVCQRLRYQNSNYSGHADDLIINWGSSQYRKYHDVLGLEILNEPKAVKRAVNKGLCFNALQEAGVPIPRFTYNYLQALDWIHQDGIVLAARTDTTSHSGKGIVISAHGDYLPRAPLYTQFTKSKGEYRVHIFNGEMIDYAKKRRRTDAPPIGIEKSIRSYNNGWIYTRKNADGEAIPIPDAFVDAAKAGVQALGLDFGAVDILNVGGEPVILEINTAPGLAGETTINSYVNAVKKHLETKQ
jgi:glutathione synthase/RimK-type ligase-like ATP-grasp enzyme